MDIGDAVRIAALSDAGLVRQNNEDRVAHDAAIGLLVVADGMGGYAGGEVASAIAIDTLLERLAVDVPACRPAGQTDADSGYARESMLLADAIQEAHRRIQAQASTVGELEQMGTTVVACLLYDNRMSIASVGDSRLYRLRDGDLEQLTLDHTLVQELVDRGFYTPAEARASVKRNVLTRALGGEQAVDVDICEEIVVAGDLYLLCSDGLTSMVTDDVIAAILADCGDSPDACVTRLVNRANVQGGKDNISVILVRVVGDFSEKRGWFGRVMDWLFD